MLVAREDTSQYRLLDKNSLYNNKIDMDCAVNKPHVITCNDESKNKEVNSPLVSCVQLCFFGPFWILRIKINDKSFE